MFVEYFYYLKEILPAVSITEYMTLLQALNKGLIHNMMDFYYISRSILCKNEHHFDLYDIAFANFFKDASIKLTDDINQEIWNWLQKNTEVLHFPFNIREFQNFNLEELERRFEQLLKEQNERHDYGNKWIGTQGQSQFGNSGLNTMGIKVAGGFGLRRAVLIAQKRIFKDYRKDIIIGTRQIKVALKRLRKLDDIGKLNELNLDKTIDLTAKNGGDIDLFFEKRKKNNND